MIIRAGYGKEKSQKDNMFETNYKKAKSAGLKVGAYWFSYAMSPSTATAEADACLSCIKGKKFELPVYYDMEYQPAMSTSNSNYTKWQSISVTNSKATALNRVCIPQQAFMTICSIAQP